jgi:hypothetical protein
MLQPFILSKLPLWQRYSEYVHSEMITAVWENTGAAGMRSSATKNYTSYQQVHCSLNSWKIGSRQTF